MRIELALNQAEITLKDIQEATFLSIQHKIEVLSLPISCLGQAKEYTDGSPIKLSAHIDCPFGQSPTELKHASIILAERRGAKMIEMPINMGWVRDEKYGEIRKDIKSSIELCNNKGMEFRLVIEYRLFTEDELKTWGEFFKKIGVDCVLTSFGQVLDDPIDNLLISKRLEKQCNFLPSSNLWQEKHLLMAKDSKVESIRFLSLPLLKRCLISGV